MTEEAKRLLDQSYGASRQNAFDPASGLPYDELAANVAALERELLEKSVPYIEIRAEMLAYLLRSARVGVQACQPYADAFDCEKILERVRSARLKTVTSDERRAAEAANETAVRVDYFRGIPDFGHLCPDWHAILDLGIPGILARLSDAREKRRAAGELSAENESYYRACVTVYRALADAVVRLADEADRVGCAEQAARLRPLAVRPPQTLAERLQTIVFFFRVFEFIDGMRTRSLGLIDDLLTGAYRADFARGVPESDLRAQISGFLYQCWAMRIPFDLPMALGGPTASELSEIILEEYTALDIHSPKLHLRVCPTLPKRLLQLAFASIRKGDSSILLINDEVCVKTLLAEGDAPEDAANYVPIGCYEPVAYAKEVGCTGNGTIDLARAVDVTLHRGRDGRTGLVVGPDTGDPCSLAGFEDFYRAFTAQLRDATDRAVRVICAYEKLYPEQCPYPLFSATYADSVEKGVDALCGGAKYNNSSLNYRCLGSAVDALTVVRRTYEGKYPFDLAGLIRMIDANWQGFEAERRLVDRIPHYGNGIEEADALAERLASDCADMCLGRPNARGGVFRPGLYSIDHNVTSGAKCGATADGRLAGEPFSKNLCSVTGKDRAGLTALIRSAARLHLDRFGNGSVLDVMIHPTVVKGEEGLEVMESLMRTFFDLGGFAMHGNVMDAETLIAARDDPQKYAHLQVRLCGWNVYFVNLSRVEQEELIRAAQTA